jgi:nucleotide-binding universal stress UspA family protein
MTAQITVGYDGSEAARQAVLWAADESSARGCTLRIVSCFEILPVALAAGLSAALALTGLVEGAESLARAGKELAVERQPDLEVLVESSPGPPGHELLDGQSPDGLVVVGASAHHGSTAFWLGSTPRYVVRHSRCPVVVVRASTDRRRPKRIVVGVDGSPSSDRAVRWAADEADVHGVPLVVAHAWWDPQYPRAPSAEGDIAHVDAAITVQRAVELARQRCSSPVCGAVVFGVPVQALLEAVRAGDVLVLGGIEHSALACAVLGSTVNAMIDTSTVPVVVVPVIDLNDAADAR